MTLTPASASSDLVRRSPGPGKPRLYPTSTVEFFRRTLCGDDLIPNTASGAGGRWIWGGVSGHDLRYNADMRRSLYLATCIAGFSLILFAAPTWAQRRGGGGGGGSHGAVSHGGFSGHSTGVFRSGSFGHSGGIRVRSGNFVNRRPFSGRRAFYPYGYYPYGYYGWYDDPLNYDAGDQDSYSSADSQAPVYPAPYPENGGLQRDVQALHGKIDRLQADVEARNRPKDQEPATALVFRDQHVEEIRNYAISGGTLWVLNEQAAKKIPLAKLDIPATVKMNDDRGVDFQVPQ